MLVGDPLDQKLFAATDWSLLDAAEAAHAPSSQQQQELAVVHPPGRPQQPLRIVRRFEFSSQLMRNLVVVQCAPGASSSGGCMSPTPASQQQQTAAAADPLQSSTAVGDLLGGHTAGVSQAVESDAPTAAASHVLYIKGSPEVIKELVQATSVPPDFDSTLAQYTREGLRVLALAQGPVLPGMLPEGAIHSYSQQQLEAAVPLQLVGLAVLSNPLRPDSAGAIQDLQNALVGHSWSCWQQAATAAEVTAQHVLCVASCTSGLPACH
jgi:cation-transporting ATPase 13A3/4/5